MRSVENPWYPELDWMKAVAIVAVVLIHSIHPFFSPDIPPLERLIGAATRFAVPAFLAVSGFLYYSAEPIAVGAIARRLRRILMPYFCMSALAVVYNRVLPSHASTDSLVDGFLYGGVFGPYYYIFVLTEFVCTTWVLSRLPRVVLHALFALAIVAALLAEMRWWLPHDFFWITRTPRLWAVWFMLGWEAGAHREVILATTLRHRASIVAAWAALFAAWVLLEGTATLSDVASRIAALAMIAVNLIGLFTFRRGVATAPRPIRILGDWTYPLYLLHPFFVYATDDLIRSRLDLSPWAGIVSCWLAGLVGALAVTMVARRTLGERSRDIIGA